VLDELKSCAPECDGLLHQRFPVDYVEGDSTGTFDAAGDLRWSGGGDRLEFDFPASPEARFLVVNALCDSGWTAYANGREVPVWPTNVAMRGVPVPPGASQVVLVYRSLLWWAWWYTPGVALLIGGVVLAVWSRSRRTLRP
jgi:hypothetical protein